MNQLNCLPQDGVIWAHDILLPERDIVGATAALV